MELNPIYSTATELDLLRESRDTIELIKKAQHKLAVIQAELNARIDLLEKKEANVQ